VNKKEALDQNMMMERKTKQKNKKQKIEFFRELKENNSVEKLIQKYKYKFLFVFLLTHSLNLF
jgi:hypothetical protein